MIVPQKARKIRCLLCVKIRVISDTSPAKMIAPCPALVVYFA